MANQDRDLPNYYDGSSQLELAEEKTDELGSKPNEDQPSQEEWRRSIGANPFGMNRE